MLYLQQVEHQLPVDYYREKRGKNNYSEILENKFLLSTGRNLMFFYMLMLFLLAFAMHKSKYTCILRTELAKEGEEKREQEQMRQRRFNYNRILHDIYER